MSREIKIGVLTFIVLVSMIWGYTFLKGRNLLSASTTLYTTFSDVTDLNISSPVLVNGYRIGSVTKIQLNTTDVKKMDVFYEVDTDYKIPVSATAVMKSLGLVGGKGLFLEFDKTCTGSDCAKSGNKLEGRIVGVLGSFLGEGEVEKYSSEFTMSAKAIISDIGKDGEPGAINEIFRQLESISKNMNSITHSTDKLFKESSGNLSESIRHLSSITESIAKNNKKIENLLVNLDKMSGDLAKAELANTVSKTNLTLDETKLAMTELKTTLVTTNNTMKELGDLAHKIDKGDGTVAMLMNDKKLYENLNTTSKNLSLLLQDVRLNPLRYVNVSVFGKKQKEYVLPQNDPAIKD
ncbi:MAG: MCE family protein [Saprospiraceae bacterium]|nr:MCE family protein [Saprospiraceae bacterium]